MKSQKFGIEIEMTGISRRTAAKTIAEYFNTRIIEDHDGYDTIRIPDNRGRYWKIVRDVSIREQNSRHERGEKVEKRVELLKKIENVKAEANKLSASVPMVKKAGGDIQAIFSKVKEAFYFY